MKNFLTPSLPKTPKNPKTTPKTRKIAGAAVALGVGAFSVGALGAGLKAYKESREPYLRQVDPELRTWSLYLPNHVISPALMLFIMGLVSKIDAIRETDRDVDIRTIEGESPDDGHPFSARHIVSQRIADAGADASASMRPAMIWTHGGGHLIGTPGFYDPQNAKIADELNISVFAPSYRKANQAPFPADLDDCYALVRWVQENAEELGVDPQRIAVCGDSAGGGLAAGIVQRAIDDGHPVAFQGLVYPMLDHQSGNVSSAGFDAHERSWGQFIWTARLNAAAWNLYLGNDHLDSELAPYASPLYREDLVDCPPTWIGIGDLDLFYPEALTFAQRLEEAGVAVEFISYEGAYHGFDHLAPQSEKTAKLHADLIAALREALETD